MPCDSQFVSKMPSQMALPVSPHSFQRLKGEKIFKRFSKPMTLFTQYLHTLCSIVIVFTFKTCLLRGKLWPQILASLCKQRLMNQLYKMYCDSAVFMRNQQEDSWIFSSEFLIYHTLLFYTDMALSEGQSIEFCGILILYFIFLLLNC